VRAGFTYALSNGFGVVPGATIWSMRSSTSGDSVMSAAGSWVVIWCMVRGPMIALVTAGWFTTNAIAISTRVMPFSSARAARASAASNLPALAGSSRAYRVAKMPLPGLRPAEG